MGGVITAVLLVSVLSISNAGQIDERRPVQARPDIRYLVPRAYRGLPRSISAYLDAHRYAIPQSCDTKGQHNAVRGRFDANAVKDWAVLASRDGYSQILMFWDGSTARVTTLNRRADTGYLQGVGEGEIGYSRTISAASRQYVLEHHRAYGGPKPPPIRHDAIDDGFSGKASALYYYDGKRWHVLQGAD